MRTRVLGGNLLREQTLLVSEVIAEDATIDRAIELQPVLSIFRELTIPMIPEVDQET